MYRIQALIFLGIISTAICAKLPNTIKPCSLSDPKINSCVLEQAQRFLPVFCEGIPELHVPKMDPMWIDVLNLDNAGLQLKITNASMTGNKGTKFQKFNVNFINNTALIDFKVDLRVTGRYDLRGYLIITLTGEGDFEMELKDLHASITLSFDIVKGKVGRSHIKPINYNVDYDILDKVLFDFKNLFNGNRLLSDAAKNFLNTRWKEIIKEIAPPAIKKIIDVEMGIVSKFMENVPFEELFTK